MAKVKLNYILDKLNKKFKTAHAFDKAVDNQAANKGKEVLKGGDKANRLNPLALYKSAYREAINPGGSKAGTCEYCLRANGRVFKGSDIILPNGVVGHHPNCVCVFTITNEAPVEKGIYTGKDFGARKTLTSNSNALNNVSTADLRLLAKKRGVKTGGKSNDFVRKNVLKSYIKR